MAHPGARLPLLEQPRRPALVRLGLIAALAAAAGGGLWYLTHRRERLEGHAFAVPSADGRLVVEVLNGTDRQGLARVATRVLRRQGIDVVFLASADAPADSTRLLVRRGDPALADRVRSALGQGAVAVRADSTRHVDVTVILGRDYRPPDELHP